MQPRYLLPLFMVCLPSHLSGQAAMATKPPGRLTVTAHAGVTMAGASSSLERAMRANGYTDAVKDPPCNIGSGPTFCPSGAPGPESSPMRARMQLGVRYRVRAPFVTELLIGQATAGTTSGNRDGDRLSVHHDATMIATLFSLEANLPTAGGRPARLHTGVGPAFLRTKWESREDSGFGREQKSTTSVGAVGNVGVVVFLNRFINVSFTGQYLRVGSDDIAAPAWSPGNGSTTVERSHGFGGVGLGISF